MPYAALKRAKKPREQHVQLNVCVPASLRWRLKSAAAEARQSVSEYVMEAIERRIAQAEA